MQHFMAEREQLQSMGHLVGQQRESPCVLCSSPATQLHLAEETPETPVQEGEKKPRRCISVEIPPTAAGHLRGYVPIPRSATICPFPRHILFVWDRGSPVFSVERTNMVALLSSSPKGAGLSEKYVDLGRKRSPTRK